MAMALAVVIASYTCKGNLSNSEAMESLSLRTTDVESTLEKLETRPLHCGRAVKRGLYFLK